MTTWIKDADPSEEARAVKFALEPFHRNIPEDALFQNLSEIWSKLGRQPKFRDLYPGLSTYSAHTYTYRFGTWRNALSRFIEWAHANGTTATSIIAPSKQHRTPRQINLKLRAEILMRDFSTCQLCGATPSDGAKLEVDHIVAWANGGETTMDNLQALCVPCNKGKSDSQFYDNNEQALADMKRMSDLEAAERKSS